MKKEYFKVYLRDENNNRFLVANCETVCKINNSSTMNAYIFRDLISQKLILPNYGYYISDNETTLTYNNYDKSSYYKISRKEILSFLRGLDIGYIELYQSYIEKLENRIVERSLTKIKEYE